jgi:hypothetical protein
MTDEDKELLKASAEAALRPFSNLIEKLFGGPAGEIGGMWQDSLRVRRFGRQLKLYAKVQRMISEAGFEPHQIPDNVALPALSYASMEDSDDLQEKWAALLANASRPDGSEWANPSFPEILHQLSPNEAKFLDALFAGLVSAAHDNYGLTEPITTRDLGETHLGTVDGAIHVYAEAGLTQLSADDLAMMAGSPKDLIKDRTNYEVALNNLLRHRLLEVRDALSLDQNSYEFERNSEIKAERRVYMTALGLNFVKACRKPEPPI